MSVDHEAAYIAADTMKFILVQEVTRVGVSGVVTADYDPIRGIAARRWQSHREA